MLYQATQFIHDSRWSRVLETIDWESPSEEGVGRLTETLSSCLAEDEADYYGIEEFSHERMKRILAELASTKNTDVITYQDSSYIPWGAASDLAGHLGKGYKYLAYHNPNKIVALKGDDLAGFISFKQGNDIFSVHAFYVAPEYRRQSIGKGLVSHTMMKARKENMSGVDINNMSRGGLRVFNSIMECYQEDDNIMANTSIDDMFARYGEIRFKDRLDFDYIKP